jgi:hypothetical protein
MSIATSLAALGHNLLLEAPEAFARGVIDVDKA